MTPLTRPYFNYEETQEVKGVLTSGLVSRGAKCEEFERAVAEYLGVEHAVAVSSCTAALHLSLRVLGIGPAHRVAVPAFTFPAVSHAVRLVGAELVFIDIDPETYNMDLDLLDVCLSSGRIDAVIPVHLFGQMLDMDRLVYMVRNSLGQTWTSAQIIEDAACALGSDWHGKKAGTFDRLGCFSFHGRKIITTGEGGMVVTNNADLAGIVRRGSMFGRDGDHFPEIGYNYKMSDINAAVGVAQMRKLDVIIRERRRLASIWDEALSTVKDINLPYRVPGALHTFQSYVAWVRTASGRDRMIKALTEAGYETQPGTYAAHVQPAYDYREKCPNAVLAAKHTLSLPLYLGLGDDVIYRMAKVIA